MFEEPALFTILEYLVRLVVILLGLVGVFVIRRYNLVKWVKAGVAAAEKLFPESGMGPEKKQYVLDFINKKFKLGISMTELELLLEAAVQELDRLNAVAGLKKKNEEDTQYLAD